MIQRADTLRDQAYTLIRDKIIKKEIPFGARISVAELSREFGISNSPIREAISRLQNEGLVVNEPNSGFRVMTLDSSNFNRIADSVEVIVNGCYDLCLRVGKIEDLTELLEDRLTIQKEKFDGTISFEYSSATIGFDRAFVDVCNNELLSRMFDSVFNMLVLCTFYVYDADPDNEKENMQQHEDILNAIKSGDQNLVRDKIAHHFDKRQFAAMLDDLS
jgi:DNA-binding GntR family transcriptional regulator